MDIGKRIMPLDKHRVLDGGQAADPGAVFAGLTPRARTLDHNNLLGLEFAAFQLFFRKLPFQGGYAVTAGLASAIEFVKSFQFCLQKY